MSHFKQAVACAYEALLCLPECPMHLLEGIQDLVMDTGEESVSLGIRHCLRCAQFHEAPPLICNSELHASGSQVRS